MGLQNTENRYRMRQRNPLPKLRSNRNPFMARTETSSLPLHQPSTGTGTARPQDQEPATHDRTRRPAGPEAPQKTPAEAAAAALKKTAPLPATPSRSRAAGNVSSTAPIIASLSGIVSWMRKANPFARRSSPGPVSNAAVPEAFLSVQISLLRYRDWTKTVSSQSTQSPRTIMRYEKSQALLRLANELQGTAEGLSLRDIQEKFSVGRRTAERMRDAVCEVFPDVEEVYLGDGFKRWRIRSRRSGSVGADHRRRVDDTAFGGRAVPTGGPERSG